jgi:hypothetical protein
VVGVLVWVGGLVWVIVADVRHVHKSHRHHEGSSHGSHLHPR